MFCLQVHLGGFRIPLHLYPALIAARAAASRASAAVAPPLEPPPIPVLLLGTGLGAEDCICVVSIRESYADRLADRCERVSQQSSQRSIEGSIYYVTV